MKQYNKTNIPLAKELRKNMTPWERKLWYEFLRDYPVRFQRQKAIGNYIADFYCAKARLVVELDGGGHYEISQQQLDQNRTVALHAMNLTVIRFSNADLDQNFRGVCEQIDMDVKKSLPQSAPLTAPSSEGAMGIIYALGFFDGVHLGHQALLEQCRRLAGQHGCKVGAVTFDIHPQSLTAGASPSLINTLSDRNQLLRQFGGDTIVCLPFDEKLRSMDWEAFLQMLRREHYALGFVCGDDFRFGYQGRGNAALLQEYCRKQQLPCAVVPEQTVDGVRVSSSHIRNLLERGNLEAARRFLGHPHVLSGQVVSGRHLGRTLGIPTANLLLPSETAPLPHGVYACMAIFDDRTHMAVTNIGARPTVGGHHVTVEPWILDFQGNLYGKTLKLEFCKFLRPERKFPSLEELKDQIQADAAETRNLLG